MKIIFLDIDGVLNTIYSDILDTSMLDNLGEIVKLTGAKVVLISTWKIFWDKNAMEEEHKYKTRLLEEFSKRQIELIGLAPNINCKRFEEIKLWLWENNGLNITNYVILDDWDCGYPKERHVQTTPFAKDGGLRKKHVYRAINILNNCV